MSNAPRYSNFNTGEVAIHHAEWPGDSPRILFMHGITGSLKTWLSIAPEIAGRHGAIAVDLRGHGRSGHSTGHYRLDDYARDMAALLDSKGGVPVVVVGHSLGAMTAVTLAAARPNLTLAVVLEDPPLFARSIMEFDDRTRYERFQQTTALASSGLSIEAIAEYLRSAFPDVPEEILMQRATNLSNMDGDAVAHIVDQRVDWTPVIEDTLRNVQCPALLMQGNFMLGAWMRDSDGERAASLMPDCTLSRWSDTGHGLHSERPERFVEEVNRFIRERVKGFQPAKS